MLKVYVTPFISPCIFRLKVHFQNLLYILEFITLSVKCFFIFIYNIHEEDDL